METIQIIWVGPFGKAVAEDLMRLRADCVAAGEDSTAVDGAAFRIRVVAAWRPVVHLCQSLDAEAHLSRHPFIPLVLEGPIMLLGPIVVPGGGSCWGCWMKRERQHGSWAERRDALLQHYAMRPGDGPQGYLRPFALMAASRIAQVIDQLDTGENLGGYLWQIDMTTGDISTSRAVGVHACPHCGLGRPSATRSFHEMQETLGYLWRQEP
jgi:bacteriocin biosynthesis cyclodehydratase domain-containing protein